MSFIGGKNGTIYAPGFFLAHEECVRETREIAQASAEDDGYGGKIVRGGTAYPSNDGNAIGIVYEDVNVTSGDMPGSVVTKGVVYEDRLAITGVDYSAVTPVSTENPSTEGWYERSGSAGSYVYTLSTDTTVNSEKTYYEQVAVRISSAAKTALAGLGFKFV